MQFIRTWIDYYCTVQNIELPSMSEENYEWLEAPKFSIRSPRWRPKKCIEQELIRASDRKNGSRNQLIERCLTEGLKASGEQTVNEASKYLPQYDRLVQIAVDLYLTRFL